MATREKNFRFPFACAAKKREFAVPVFHLQQQTEIAVFPFVPFSFCSRVSPEVDFWNSVDVIVFTELVFASSEFHVQNSTKWT
jgi:hypothetical protein